MVRILQSISEEMKVRIDRCELARAPDGDDRFEAVRERMAPVIGGPYYGHSAMRHAIVECRTHELIDGQSCSRCIHFLNAVPTADGQSVLVRCLLLETDAVEALMTRAEDLVTVDETEPTGTAAARMLDRRIDQILVTSGEEVVGFVRASSLERAPAAGEETVASHMEAALPVVSRTATLGAVARSMRTHGLDMVLVLDGHAVVGVVTRGDLRRAGVPGM